MRPSYWMKYNHSTPYKDRMDTIISWLDLPDAERPSFMCVYFDRVDSYGHEYGPYSPQVKAAIQEVDGMIGYLIAGVCVHSVDVSFELI